MHPAKEMMFSDTKLISRLGVMTKEWQRSMKDRLKTKKYMGV